MTRARMGPTTWRHEWRLSLVFVDGETQVTYHATGENAWDNAMCTVEDYGRELASFFIVQVR